MFQQQDTENNTNETKDAANNHHLATQTWSDSGGAPLFMGQNEYRQVQGALGEDGQDTR